MAVSLRFDSTTAAAVLAASSFADKLTALKTAMGTGTQTVSIKDGSAVEKLTGTFAGTAYGTTGATFLPRTLLSADSGSGGTAAANWTLRVTNGSGKWFDAEFGTGEVWTATTALDAADDNYITLALAGDSTGDVTITESMARWYWDTNFTFAQSGAAPKRNVLFTGHLAPNGPGINGRVDYEVPAAGLVDPFDSKTKISRVANGSSYVWRSILSKGEPVDYWNTRRMKFYANYDESIVRMPHGEEIWIAFAFKTPSITLGGSGTNFVVSTSNSGNSGVYFYLGGSNALSIAAWYNPEPDTTYNGVTTGREYCRVPSTGALASGPETFFSTNLATSSWQHFVMRARFSYLTADNPFMQVWHKEGNGALNQVVANTYRNAWNTPVWGQWTFPDCGQYFFSLGDTENYGDPWNGAAVGTDMTWDYAGCVCVPVASAPGADQQDLLRWLTDRTGAT